MAYVLGYLYADGNVMDLPYMRAKYVSVTSIDIDSIKRIQAWLGSSHRIIERASQWEHGNKTYTLRIGSHALYDSLFHLGLRPRKSLTVTMPEIPSRYFMDFVRGYFDGDGCVYLEKITRKNGLIRPRNSARFLLQEVKPSWTNYLNCSIRILKLSTRRLLEVERLIS